MYLNDPINKDDIIAVIALLDLYGPDFYPDKRLGAEKRYNWAKNFLEEKVDVEKFYQFFAVHELEAWLFSDPEIFSGNIKNKVSKFSDHPEEINFNNPPKKRLEQIYHDETEKRYKAVVHGYALFNKLNPSIAYDKCPRLKEMLDFMLKLAKEAGQ